MVALTCRSLRAKLFLFLLIVTNAASFAFGESQSESNAPSVSAQTPDDADRATLLDNRHPLSKGMADMGAIADDTPLSQMILILKRSPDQDRSMHRFLDDLQNPHSANYHRWLDPLTFGAKFGPAPNAIKLVTGWLSSQGFSIDKVANGRNIIVFSGTQAQLKAAFHAEIHQYQGTAVTQFENSEIPTVPAILSQYVTGIASLNDFKSSANHSKPFTVVKNAKGELKRTAQPGGPSPDYTIQLGSQNFYAVSPYDFATLYNVSPLWNEGLDGTGQSIAIAGRSEIDTTDIDTFRTYFGLPPTNLQVIHNGPSPGLQIGDQTESTLDVEWAGAIAKNAVINLVESASTLTTDGVQLSAQYVIDNNLAPVLDVSYSACELGLGNAGNQLVAELWEQAAAEGITVVVSSGDSGSAGCDGGYNPASYGLEVNGLASTPYNTAVGGTDLYGTYLNPSTYWAQSNDPSTHSSALQYIPELPWNNSCGNPQLLAALQALGATDTTEEELCNDSNIPNAFPVIFVIGGSGGASGCLSSTNIDPNSCNEGYKKPTWQTILASSNQDTVRDVPDVSFFAGSGLWGAAYILCERDLTFSGAACNFNSDAQYLLAGGTSFAAPAFAGVVALANEKLMTRQGNANYALYKMGSNQYGSNGHALACDSSSAAPGNQCFYYDISQGSNAVPCWPGTKDCQSVGQDFVGLLPEYNATPGYDRATGLGSINVANLVNNWSAALSTSIPTQTTLNLNQTSVQYGVPLQGTITATPASGSAGIPSGDTSLISPPNETGFAFGPFTLTNGTTAVSVTTPGVGKYTVQAHYGGDAVFAASTSTAVSFQVTPASTTATLSASRVTVSGSQGVLLSVAITTASNATSPTGTVTFIDKTTGSQLGSVQVQQVIGSQAAGVDGALSVPASALAEGANSISASYSGDGNYLASTASEMTVSRSEGFTLALSSGTLPVQAGKTGQVTVTINSTSGSLSSPVSLSCPGAPSGVVCSFQPSTLASGSTTATSVLTVTTDASALGAHQKERNRVSTNQGTGLISLKTGVISLAFLGVFLPIRRRSRALVVLCLASTMLVACSGGSRPIQTAISLSISPATGLVGTTLQFTARVSSGNSTNVPAGTVTFTDGKVLIGTASLTEGTATLSSNSLSFGSHSVIASYAGQSQFDGSVSSAQTVDLYMNKVLEVQATDAQGDAVTLPLQVQIQ